MPLLLAFEPWLRGSAPLLVGLPLGLLIIALTLPMAIAAERWIERPGIRLGARIATAWPFSRVAEGRAADLGAEAPLASRTGP